MTKPWLKRALEEHTVFLFLLAYRWLSLLPPLLALGLASETSAQGAYVFLAIFVDNLLLTIFYPRINRPVTHLLVVFGVDLIIIAMFIALKGHKQRRTYFTRWKFRSNPAPGRSPKLPANANRRRLPISGLDLSGTCSYPVRVAASRLYAYAC